MSRLVDIAALRELDADVPAVTPQALHEARARLRREIARETGPPRTPLPAGLIASAAAAVAVALAAVLLGGGREALPEPRLQLTSAAGVLQLAAQAARAEAAGDVPRDDQYLYRKDVTVERPLGGTGTTRRFVDESWVSVDGSRPTRNSELGKVWYTSGPGGPPTSRETLEQLPTEPGRLLLSVRDWPRDGLESSDPMSPDDYEHAYAYLAMLLYHQPPMPPLLRPAAFDAIARIPGVAIVDDDVVAGGRRGLAISRPGSPGDQALVLDAATYEYLGLRSTDARADGERVERVSTRVATGVVDAIGERPGSSG